MNWHALYILFLSQSEDPRDHEFIRAGLADAARYGLTVRTAAFASALIEIDGREAIEHLTELYLRNPDRRPEELAAIHAALRVHGDEGRPELRPLVVSAYGALLKKQPDLAATARIRSHLRAAAAAEDSTPTAETASMAPMIAIVAGLLLIPLLLAFQGRSKAAQAA
jgi:hypothetical protein